MDPDPARDEENFAGMRSFEFNSSFGLCTMSTSSDEDDDPQLQLDEQNEGDHLNHDEAYIELELRPATVLSAATRDDEDDGIIINKRLMEDQFRFSFSEMVPFPGFRPSINSTTTPPAAANTSNNDHVNSASTNEYISDQYPTRRSSTNIFPAAGWMRLADHGCRIKDDGNTWELLVPTCNRWKLSSEMQGATATSAGKSGMMKLVMKLSSVMSGLRPAGLLIQTPNTRRINTLIKQHLDKWFSRRRKHQQQMMSITSSKNMKYDDHALRKTTFGNTSNSNSGTVNNKSCPTSVKSSPLHQGDASLLHAAIAHCKKSFGQESDFSF